MIRYNLTCKNNHEFESWFSDSLEFEKLNKKNLLECIHCNSKKIKKSIMSPSILNSNTNITHKNYDKNLKKIKKDLLKLRKFVEKNFEYVGDKLASNVRNIYYDKNWLFEDHSHMVKEIGYIDQWSYKMYKYWLDNFSLKYHNDLINRLSKFVKSSEYRMRRSNF